MKTQTPTPSIQTCTVSWRTVSRSTVTMTPLQVEHGGKETRADGSPTEAPAPEVGGQIGSVRRAWQTAVLRADGHKPVWLWKKKRGPNDKGSTKLSPE
jgi:hypothetical protein